MAPGLSWPPTRVSPVPGAGVGTLFTGCGDTAGEAGGIFVKSLFELPADGVGSAGLDAGTLCDGDCWFICPSTGLKIGATGLSVTTVGLLKVTSTILFCTKGVNNTNGFSPLAFALDILEDESPPEPDAPSEPESPSDSDSPPELELPRKFPVSTEPESSSGCTKLGRFVPSLSINPTLVVPILGTSVNAIGTPCVLTGHGGGGVMKVGSGLDCPGKIVVV